MIYKITLSSEDAQIAVDALYEAAIQSAGLDHFDWRNRDAAGITKYQVFMRLAEQIRGQLDEDKFNTAVISRRINIKGTYTKSEQEDERIKNESIH